jgi:hypothetical protein
VGTCCVLCEYRAGLVHSSAVQCPIAVVLPVVSNNSCTPHEGASVRCELLSSTAACRWNQWHQACPMVLLVGAVVMVVSG